MRPRVKQKLISLLRSGFYNQGRGALLFIDKKGVHRFCVTGLICQLYEEATGRKAGKFRVFPVNEQTLDLSMYDRLCKKATHVYSILGYVESPPPRVIEWAGTSDEVIDQLILMNDTGVKFKTIADRLERGDV